MGVDGFEPRPQDLVMTFLGAYVLPHDRLVWSGGLVTLLGEFGFSMGAARIALARMVRRGLLDRLKDGRLVSYRPTPQHRRAAGGGRSADLLARARAAQRGTVDRAVARDPGGAAAGAGPACAAVALPRLRLGPGWDLDLAARPRAGGRRGHRRAGHRGVRGRDAGASRPPRSTSARSWRGPGISMRSTSATAPSSTSSRPTRDPGGCAGWTIGRRSCCARAWCTSSGGSRRSTRSCRTTS